MRSAAEEADATADEQATSDAAPRRRRSILLALVGAGLVTALLAPVSPVSPFSWFDRDDSDERARPEASALPTTTTGRLDQVPRPGPTIISPTSITPELTAPPTTQPLPPVTVPEPAPISGAGYQLAFADDFGGTALDAVWATAPFGGSLPPTVADGVLTVETTAANNHRWGYVASTGPRSEAEPNYPSAEAWQTGYFEARLRYTDNPWSWPAFWLFSMAKTEAWPDEDCSKLNAEWDIMENGVQNGDGERPAANWYFTALHRNTTDNTDDGYCGTPDEHRGFSSHLPDVELSDWHTWSAHWSADTFCTYLDGIELQCMEPWDSTHQPMHLTFTMQYLRDCEGCPPRPPELELQVDWVRVWQAS